MYSQKVYIIITYDISVIKCFILEIEFIQRKHYLWERGFMLGKHLD